MIRLYNNIVSGFYFLGNYFAIKRAKVTYKQFPVVYGKLIIKNNGRCQLGENVTFKSSVSSNYVGLTKKCSLFIENGGQLVVGNNSGFSGISIYCSKYIKIGDFVNCGGNVNMWDTDFHPLDFEARRVHQLAKIVSAAIEIGNDVFIGANATILKGVTIGDRSIVGACSVVTKSIPADEVWAGNPARFIRKLDKTNQL